jgi:predicted MPP superfamily phosphohydrolase
MVGTDAPGDWPPAALAAAASAGPVKLRCQELEPPTIPRHKARLLFHPRRGWVRRIERGLNHFLSARIFPYVPGMARPYGRVLARSLCVSYAEVAIARLPAALAGLRVLLLSDIHVGPFVMPAALERTARALMQLKPDLVVLGGDLVTARIEDLDGSDVAFEPYRAAPLGAHAVLGNHDHYTGAPQVVRARLEHMGIAVLHNRWVAVERAGGRLALAGIDDLNRGEPDLEAALRGAPEPRVLVSHNPDVLFDAAEHAVALVLSGHTHAGQVRIPGLPVIVRQSRYHLDEGRYRLGSTELVVSRGLGVSGLPVRIACSPEAVLLRLVPGEH